MFKRKQVAKIDDDRKWDIPAPHGITPVKGSVHTILNRATVEFIVHDKIAQDFLEWLKTTFIPDETLWASINYNPHLKVPGTYNGSNFEEVEPFSRYKSWRKEKGACASGQFVQGICILSTGDLPRLAVSPYLFANKFYLHQDRVVIGCLEERLFNTTRDYMMGWKSFNASRYENLDFVLNQVSHPSHVRSIS
ncbi:beta-1,3-galactosyl-O-glycosyl-glycoprotein beta-1,6-N-acetylglucosaminyltransferase [Elysia marginata]|uniref:Beta-1,3-galactosyl-O-glycosyl-glycoprotein beta-1,6-N-acetylglucosaminyltransferase n=1 Tax=Elysia marginata TaxID=1093978 RepID=A0AAV4IQT5_9GAST|nr:beta-1,3-galactosyl-O-glycosyl-glycoprotein beta-1,6-N-acetylglucosaminyltransferase [Elysia marginata]